MPRIANSAAALVLGFAAWCAAGTAAAAQPAGDQLVWPTVGWSLSTPEAEGMSSSALAALVDLGSASAMDSLLVVRHGRIVAEAHYAPFGAGMKHALYSATKGVLGSLVGIAQARGQIERLDRPVLEALPERQAAHAEGSKRSMTIEHLLDMTSGLDWQEPLGGVPQSLFQMERSPDWTAFALDRPMAQVPGAGFNYNSGNSQLLAAVLDRATGADALAFAQRELFAPLGITDVAWRRAPGGMPIGGYGLYLQPRDMAKIGLLHLRAGRWEDRQLLPVAWAQSIAASPVDMLMGNTPAFRYGKGWWSIPSAKLTMAVGYLRQLIVVLPDIDVVVVATGRAHYRFGPLLEAVGAAVRSDRPLPPDAAAQDLLAESIRRAATEPPAAVAGAPATAQQISGRSYSFGANRLGLRSLRLDLLPESPRVELVFEPLRPSAAPRRFAGPIGLDGTFRTTAGSGDILADPPRAAKGRWTGERRFEFEARLLADGIVSTYTLDFGHTGVELRFADNRGNGATLSGRVSTD